MNDQEPQNQGDKKEQEGVDKRRRFIKGAGVAAPVVLTLSSPSVFGAMCLSQIMSGNESHTGTGSCTLGQNPAYWRSPDNKDAWRAAVYSNNASVQSGSPCSSYNGGTKFKEVFGGNISEPMRKILCDTPNSLNSYLIAAFLDASTPGSNYLYTAAQVIQLQQKSLGVPPYNSTADEDVLAFLKTTMNP